MDGYYVIVRGTVKIEQKAARYKDKADVPPIVIRTCYDGDQFAEMVYFKSRIGDESSKSRQSKKGMKEEGVLGLHVRKQASNHSAHSQLQHLFGNQNRFIADEEMQDLSEAEAARLN